MDVITLCFSEKLPAAGNLVLYSEGNDNIWNEQGFPPQIQRADLTTEYFKSAYEYYNNSKVPRTLLKKAPHPYFPSLTS